MSVDITPGQFLAIATGVSAICFLLAALLLIGFRRGRLRVYNIVVVFVMSFVSAVYYLRFGARLYRLDLEMAAWAALAACAAYGLLGMVRLARESPPVWRVRRTRHRAK